MTEIENYIGSILPEKPSDDQKKDFWRLVNKYGPSGCVRPISVDGQPVSMIVRTIGDEHMIIIPLTRMLSREEVETIIDHYDEEEFEIEATTRGPDQRAIAVEKEAHDDLCAEWSRRRHNSWVDKRLEQGWKWGEESSISKKTSPMLRRWDELPESARFVDYQAPNDLIDLLRRRGYEIVDKIDADHIKAQK